MNIYFVCTGNTCRSPMAEAILRSREIEGVTVKSAGVHAIEGGSISTHARSLIEENELPHTPTSRIVRAEEIDWATYVLTMTTGHRDMLHMLYPEAAHKIQTLKQFAGEDNPNVQDPFGGTRRTYEATYEELERVIDRVVERLEEET